VELDEATKLKLTCLIEGFSSDEEDESQQGEMSNQLADDNIDESDSFNNKQEGLSAIKKINLDVTSMIALVSEMTNGGENFPYKQPFLQRQAEWERLQRLNPALEEFMKGACE
jgi:hypothetical protein